MKWNNSRGWRKFIYGLLYPGVLGSMLFDMLDPLRPVTYMTVDPSIKWGLRAIAFAFVADFLHLVVDLKAKTSKRTIPSLDTIIALTFCLSYFWLSKMTAPATKAGARVCYNCGTSLMFLGIAYFSIYKYERLMKAGRGYKDLVRLIPMILCSIGLIIVFLLAVLSADPRPIHATFTTITLSSFVYIVYVFIFGHKE